MNLQTKFLQIYANLPLNQRQGVVAVIDNEPLSWNAVKLEVDQDTEKGKQILELLVRLGIIK
ncbi:MAG: hypothetical protein U1E54_01185 [Candidatus Levybacteria bacterium]|nr:hypothetical protein [Candidatus Levybacteria bacterium]